MSQQITIHVSEQVARRAERLAAQTQQRVEDVLADWLEGVVTEEPVAELADDEVLQLTELHLTEEEENTLSDLLDSNRERGLDEAGRRRLDELMLHYEQGLLRKAQALRVAAQRGLIEPLHHDPERHSLICAQTRAGGRG